MGVKVRHGDHLFQDQEGLGFFPPPFTGHASHQAIDDCWMQRESRLDIVWRDGDPSALEYESGTTADPVAAVMIANGLITCPVPAFRHCPSGRIRIVPVPGEEE